MKKRLADLRFVIGDNLHIHILPGVGSRGHSFSLCFVGLDLDNAPHYLKWKKIPGRCLRLDHGVKYLFFLNGKPANRRFCRGTTRNKKSGVDVFKCVHITSEPP
jgi:hypothetical protein